MDATESGLYPSFREIRDNGDDVCFCDATERLYWTLQDAFPNAVSVMKSRTGGLDEREPFVKPDGTLHEIASLPLTTRKVSSVDATIPLLDQWESDWAAYHKYHTEGKWVSYRDLDDNIRPYPTEMNEDGSWDDNLDTQFLIRCCGQDRPSNKHGQRLRIIPLEGNNFITIYDFISSTYNIFLWIYLRSILTNLISYTSMGYGPT